MGRLDRMYTYSEPHTRRTNQSFDFCKSCTDSLCIRRIIREIRLFGLQSISLYDRQILVKIHKYLNFGSPLYYVQSYHLDQPASALISVYFVF